MKVGKKKLAPSTQTDISFKSKGIENNIIKKKIIISWNFKLNQNEISLISNFNKKFLWKNSNTNLNNCI